MRLYTYFRSSAAYRVRIALNAKGIEVDALPVHLRRQDGEQHGAAYRSQNPQGLVPALEVGGRVIAQSFAIFEYLEETHPAPPLLPEDPLERALVRAFALNIVCDIHPLNNLRVLEYLRRGLGSTDADVQHWYEHWIAEGFQGLEALARVHSTARRYVFGDRLTLADVCLVPQVFNARRFNCDLTPYPTLTAIDAHLTQLPPFVKARPDQQPDAEVSA
jgi:maleylacetoacetate isomerase